MDQLDCTTEFVEASAYYVAEPKNTSDRLDNSREEQQRIQAAAAALPRAPPKNSSSSPGPAKRTEELNMPSSGEMAIIRKCSTHQHFDNDCAECRWWLHGKRLREASVYSSDLLMQQCMPAIVARGEGSTWGLGCQLCARFVADCVSEPATRWSKFAVCGAINVRKDNVTKHLNTQLHQKAMAHYDCKAHAVTNVEEGDREFPAQKHPLQNSSCGLDGAVPRRDKFVQVIKGCSLGLSVRSFANAYPLANEASSNLVVTGCFRDESRLSCSKMITSVAAVLDNVQAALLRKSVRIAFAEDDRDGVRILRVRVVWTTPQVGFAEFFASLVRNPGFSSSESSASTLRTLRRLAYVHDAVRQKGNTPGVQEDEEEHRRMLADGQVPHLAAGGGGDDDDDDSGEAAMLKKLGYRFDRELWEHIRVTIFSGSSDGALTALQGINGLKTPEVLPNLRYQFRDRPHTTRTCCRVALDMCPESSEMRELLITGKQSFAKRAAHSLRFQEIWRRQQRLHPQDAEFKAVLRNLGYAKQRFDSRSKPMTRLLQKIGPAICVLEEMASDVLKCHSTDRAWADKLLRRLCGPKGFVDMVMFAVDTDFAVATYRLTQVQDQSEADASLSVSQVQKCLDECCVMFEEGRVFEKHSVPNGTYTNALLHSFFNVSKRVILRDGSEERFGWPRAHADEGGLLHQPVAHAKRLYRSVKLFLDLNFPHHSWRSRLCAFNLEPEGGTSSTAAKRENIKAFAVKEGVDASRAAIQFLDATVHVRRFFKQFGNSRAAWAKYLDECCRCRRHRANWRPQSDALVPLILTYLGVLDNSSQIERHFSELGLLETKRGAHHHAEHLLQAALKIRLSCPQHWINEMVVFGSQEQEEEPTAAGAEEAGKSDERVSMGDQSQASVLIGKMGALQFLRRCQAKYADIYGKRSLASRSTKPVPLHVKAAKFVLRRARWSHKAPAPKPGSQPARSAAWGSGVRNLVAEHRKRAIIGHDAANAQDAARRFFFSRSTQLRSQTSTRQTPSCSTGVSRKPRPTQSRSNSTAWPCRPAQCEWIVCWRTTRRMSPRRLLLLLLSLPRRPPRSAELPSFALRCARCIGPGAVEAQNILERQEEDHLIPRRLHRRATCVQQQLRTNPWW